MDSNSIAYRSRVVTSPTLSNPNPPDPTFSGLPAEIRHKIWVSTFEPRILSLYWYEQPVPNPSWNRWVYTFTVRLGLHVDQLSPEEAPQNHSLNPQIHYEGKDLFADHTRMKSPPGPICLQVCRESREIALKHYETFLPGILQVPSGRTVLQSRSDLDDIFEEVGYATPHTWVNPKIDLIFLSTMSRDITSPYAPVDAQVFQPRAKAECTKFERIGVMIHNGDPSLLLAFREYTGLKEVTIFNTHRDAAKNNLALAEDEEFVSAEEVAQFVVEYLTDMKAVWEEKESRNILYEPWVLPIPEVKVSSAIEWYRNIEGKLKLRLAPAS